jgi:hypothetical protein
MIVVVTLRLEDLSGFRQGEGHVLVESGVDPLS